MPGYGPAVAADVGIAIKGRIIDLWMPSTAQAREVGPEDRHDHDLPLDSAAAVGGLRYTVLSWDGTLALVRRSAAVAFATAAASTGTGGTARPRRPSSPGARAPEIDPSAHGRDRRRSPDRSRPSTQREHRRSLSRPRPRSSRLVRGASGARARATAFEPRSSEPGASGRVWNGNLCLVGFGDPTLDRRDLDRLAPRFAATGIRRIDGARRSATTRTSTPGATAPGWKPCYLGIESRPISALVGCRPATHRRHSSAVAAARAFVARTRATRSLGERHGRGRGAAPADALPLAFDHSDPLSTIVRQHER